ncbi:BlaI/MecI/CopY family transcriptional regulator OS=Streptomyces tendae OX=1932 GN=GUR47_05420 PE=4 SV=1 [Streptomyces tendae]
MSESTMQSATELASQYSVRVTDDLERNVKEQERVSTEITALQQQLAALQHDHALLVNMQQALGITSPPRPAPASGAAPETEAATVPAPRDGAAAKPAAGSRTRSKKAGSAPKRGTAAKPGAKQASKPAAKKATRSTAASATEAAAGAPAGTTAEASTGAPVKTAAAKTGKSTAKPAAKSPAKPAAKKAPARESARPTLVELVREHLAGQREPRSAAEVATALGQAHSGRTVKNTVVRTTLEGLVAKNQAQRSKQGTSVYYIATDAAAPAQKQDAAPEGSAQSGS